MDGQRYGLFYIDENSWERIYPVMGTMQCYGKKVDHANTKTCFRLGFFLALTLWDSLRSVERIGLDGEWTMDFLYMTKYGNTAEA